MLYVYLEVKKIIHTHTHTQFRAPAILLPILATNKFTLLLSCSDVAFTQQRGGDIDLDLLALSTSLRIADRIALVYALHVHRGVCDTTNRP